MSLDSLILIDSHANIGKTSLPRSNATWRGLTSTRPWGHYSRCLTLKAYRPGWQRSKCANSTEDASNEDGRRRLRKSIVRCRPADRKESCLVQV